MISAVSSALRFSVLTVACVLLSASASADVPAAPKDSAKTQESPSDKVLSQLTPREIAILKLNSITIKHAQFENETVPAVLKELSKQAKALDPDGKGVKMTFIPDPKQAKTPPTITFSLDGMTLGELLKHICRSDKLKIKVHESGVVILTQPPAEDSKASDAAK